MSSQRSGGVRSITLVKLTTSLAAVSPAIAASTAIRPAAAGSPRPQCRASRQRVGAGIAQHGPLAEILAQQRERGAERTPPGPLPPAGGAEREQPAASGRP